MSLSLENGLKSKKICRFCLSQDEKFLTNMYSKRLKNSAPLPQQVIACLSKVTNDDMPNTICDVCRMVMDYCYRFKQMCERADTALIQFALTGKSPTKLDHPKVPEDLINMQYPKTLNPDVQVKSSDCVLTSSKKRKPEINKSISIQKQKLLNKNPVKILNEEASTTGEPILKKPKTEHSKDGTIGFTTEIIETENYKEIDLVQSAKVIETNIFPCSQCDRSFRLQQLLDIHLVNHSRERNFPCEHCDKKFFTKNGLKKHTLIHSSTAEKPYKCVVCDKAFTRSTYLQRHEKIHTDAPKFLCVHCDKLFISKEVFEKHIERHYKNRLFSCKTCKMSFVFKLGLEKHEIIHAKKQPFPCQYCSLSFSTVRKLLQHLTGHAGTRPYLCKICSKSYVLSRQLTQHLKSHGEGAPRMLRLR